MVVVVQPTETPAIAVVVCCFLQSLGRQVRLVVIYDVYSYRYQQSTYYL